MFSTAVPYYELARSVLLSAGISPKPTMELDTIEAAKKMVEEGIGISLLPRVAILRELERGLLKEVPMSDAPSVKRVMLAIFRKDVELGRVTQASRNLRQSGEGA
ncbi:MAG: hypothetical protein HY675_21945 [Chloroflexi bacterium]|nr:hypothetical protein [Chloroflexota bacterium]